MILFLSALLLGWVPQDGDKERPQPRPERPQDGDRPRPPRPPGPPEAPGRDRRPAGFSPEEVRAWVKENEPETWKQVQRLEEGNRREEANRLLMEAGPRMRELKDLKDRDPKGWERSQELRGLERRSVELGERARQASGAERDKALGELKELLGNLFDAREETRNRELGELKRRVAEIEKSLAERKSRKEGIVERRRRELMGEAVNEDW